MTYAAERGRLDEERWLLFRGSAGYITLELMRHPLFFCIFAFVAIGAAQATPLANGLWRYKDRGVWVQIDNGGAAFQCRIDKDEKTSYTSKGKVVGDTIEWQDIWGIDKFEVAGDTLFINASGRRIEFARAKSAMSPLCRNPLASAS